MYFTDKLCSQEAESNYLLLYSGTISFASQICSTAGVTVPTNAQQACASGNSTSSTASGASSTASSTGSTSSSAAAATKSSAGVASREYIGSSLGLAAAGLLAALL